MLSAKVGEICDKLCDLILDGKAELRDIYSIGQSRWQPQTAGESAAAACRCPCNSIRTGLDCDRSRLLLLLLLTG